MRARTSTRTLIGIVGAAALAAGGALVLAPGAGAAPTTEEFEFTGEAQDFVVPAGVCQITVDAFGAAGGTAIDEEEVVPGGLGGRATATVTVSPGETLQVNVGGVGGDSVTVESAADDETTDAAGDDPVSAQAVAGGAGGFNGGGEGGAATDGEDPGAGGGGASDVRRGASGESVVVAGGGGGAGGGNDADVEPPHGVGGDGGGLSGADGEPGHDANPAPDPAQAGKGGTQTAGGAGGTATIANGNGDDGTSGTGGAGGPSLIEIDTVNTDGGGGGGGGWFGGGGGGAGLETNSTPELEDGAGGGGGSGFGPAGVTFETGTREGDGFVSITWDPAVNVCPIAVEPTFTG